MPNQYLTSGMSDQQWSGLLFVLLRAVMERQGLESIEVPFELIEDILNNERNVATSETESGILLKTSGPLPQTARDRTAPRG